MKRVMKGLALAIAVVVIVYPVLFSWARLRGPTEAQAKALALMQQDLRPKQGRNAFPALWLARYDVPADRLDAVYAQDRQRFAEWLAAHPDGGDISEFASAADAQYPKLPALEDADRAITCRRVNDDDCLVKVRQHQDALRALLAREQVRLKRDQAIVDYDYEWNDLTPSVNAIPAYGQTQTIWPTAIALTFVDGHQAEALDQVCAYAQAMRRMHAHSNTLIGTLLAAARLRGASRLFVQMLSELPPDAPLPDSCTTAFAAVGQDDADWQASMQWELRFVEASYRLAEGGRSHWWDALLFSATGTRRMTEAYYAWLGSDVMRTQVLDDRLFTVQQLPRQASLLDWISNPAGSSSVSESSQAYVSYLNGQQDTIAALRMTATILWLRQTRGAGRPLAARLAQRPAWMQFATDRGLRVSADGRSLHLGEHSKGSSKSTEWPLPAEL